MVRAHVSTDVRLTRPMAWLAGCFRVVVPEVVRATDRGREIDPDPIVRDAGLDRGPVDSDAIVPDAGGSRA